MNNLYVAPELRSATEQLKTLAAAAERRGRKTIVFCEDQLTLMAERSICEGVGGTFSVSVTTLARFLQNSSAGIGKILSRQGSVMAMRRILTEREGELQCFGGRRLVRSSAKKLFETITRLVTSKVRPEDLKEADCRDNVVLGRKISDLALLYEAYESFLEKNSYLDESDTFRLLPEAIRSSEELAESDVIFFGFPVFTKQMLDGVAACMERTKTTGIFLGGTAELYVNEAEEGFTRMAESLGGCARFELPSALSGEAEWMRTRLYRPESFAEAGMRTDRIHLFAAAGVDEELAEIASRVCAFVRGGARYREIAVLLGDVSAYALPLRKVFAEYGIPFFLDVKKPLSEHPLARFCLDALTVSAEGYSPSSVARFTGNALFGESAAYRNYLLKYANYRGGAKREIRVREDEAYDTAPLSDCRTRLLSYTDFPKKGKGAAYIGKLNELLSLPAVEAALGALEEKIEDTSLLSFLSQGRDGVSRLFNEALSVVGEDEFSCKEFCDLIEEGFGAFGVSLIPLKNDAVFVGDGMESRILPVKHLFCAGMTDGVPRYAEDVSFISDQELGYLESIKIAVEPTIQRANLRVREGLALGVCSFTDTLFFSYPMSRNGDETAKSELFSYLSALFTRGAGELPVSRRGGDSLAHAVTESLALKRLFVERAKKIAGEKNDFDSLYAALAETELRFKLEKLCAEESPASLRLGEALFFHGRNEVSPTLLESYFACPYRCFAERGLGLKLREERTVLYTDSGTFVHAVLEEIARGIQSGDISSEESCRTAALQIAEEKMDHPPFSYLKDTPSGAYTTKSLVAEAVTVSCVAYRQTASSAFVIAAVEQPVRTRLTDTGIRGKIDRVDTSGSFVRVIDYKTGSIDDSPSSYYVGKKLQLELYLKAIAANGTPAGALYFPAAADYTARAEERFRMKGFLNGDTLCLHDVALSQGGKSEIIAASAGRRSDKVMEEDAFRSFLDYGVLVANRGARELKDGFIAATPYDGSCDYCSLKGMCRGKAEYTRKEASVSCEQIAAIAAREKGE